MGYHLHRLIKQYSNCYPEGLNAQKVFHDPKWEKIREVAKEFHEILCGNVNVTTEIVVDFSTFLTAAWPSVDNLTTDHNWDEDVYILDDFVQYNWDLLVGRELFGENNILAPLSPNILDTTKPKYYVGIHPGNPLIDIKTGENIPISKDLRFIGYTSKTNTGFGLYPPFDIALLLKTPTPTVVHYVELSKIKFTIYPYADVP